jgi:UPF0755 protein
MITKNIFGFLSTMALVVFCLIVLISVWIAIDLPMRAEKTFGPPSDALNPLQRLDLSFRLIMQVDEIKQPADPEGAGRTFEIGHGEATYSITQRLQQEGFVISAQGLRDYLVYSGLDTTLQAGEFQISPKMTGLEIAWALQDATPTEVTFTILPGWRLEEIAESLPTSGLEFRPRDFLATANQPPAQLPLLQQLPPGVRLEGFFYPDSYRVPRKISAEDFIELILQDFQAKVDHQIQDGFQRQDLNLFEAVTLASIVQREAVKHEEMPLIASVFLNRIQAGMKLDTDPTVQYALGYDRKGRTWWKNPLSLEDLQVNSPYNTYQNYGLPPGPIANPGLSAMRAVAFPAQTPYYYFRSACDGSGRHSFAENFEQHQQNACPE